MPNIVMMVGLPGSGKSTIARIHYPNHVVISTDSIVETYAKENETTYSAVFDTYIKTATKKMHEQLEWAIDSNLDIVWDQTNLTRRVRASKLRLIPEHYDRHAVVVSTSPGELVRRLSEREKYEGKYIPPHVMRQMVETFQPVDSDEGFHLIKVIVC